MHLKKKINLDLRKKNDTDTFNTVCQTVPSSGAIQDCSFVCHIPSLAILAQTTHACFSGEDGISPVL